MKILYVIDQNIESGKTSGIIHKIKNKIEIWSQEGVTVEIMSLYSFKLYDSNLKLIDDSKSYNLKRHGRYFTLARMLYSTFLLYNFLKNNNYDLMYIRQRPYMPFTQRCFKLIKTVIEINTYDVGEYKAISKAMYIINNLTRDRFYRHARGFLCVTKELEDIFSKQYNLPSLTIANGVDSSKYIIKNNINEKPRLVFVGSPGYEWHGIDKVEYLANKLKEFDFHLVGMDGVNRDNITYHGYCSLEKTKEIVGACDVGICSLSLHVKDMDEASPLKSRQYLAQGLPVIYAYNDTDMKGDERFALKIANSKTNVISSLENIKHFVEEVYSNKDISVEAKEFAKNILDTSIKEKVRLKFLNEIKNKMHIIYLIDQNIEEGKTAGIVYKVRDQIQQWEREGIHVRLISLYSFKVYDTNLNLIDSSYFFSINAHNSLVTLFRLFYSTLKLLFHLNSYSVDLIYMRTRPYMPFTRLALKNKKIIMELNTNDIEEWKSLNKIMHIYNLSTRKLFYSLAIGFTAVGDEIAKIYESFNKPIKIIGNAIKVEDYKLIEETGNERPRICFVGSPGFPWHGIDKIRFLATKVPEADFIFIGESGEDYDNVKFYGYCSLDKVTNLLHTCDIAIGTMSLHEKGMDSTSTIKTRQYLAQGLPIFYGYRETDFTSKEDFLLELPNTPDNVTRNVEKIREFIFYCFQNKELRIKCRKFAESFLDVSVKEHQRVEFIKKVYFDSQTKK
tara:strand:- start:114165 stop:116354 length:2190 start_codon:yes stop_codon:yes gene_type:complete